MNFVAYFVLILLTIVLLAFYARVIVWILMMVVPDLQQVITLNIAYRVVFNLSEPVIAPFRRLVPMTGSIDFISFILALISLSIMRLVMTILAQAKFLF